MKHHCSTELYCFPLMCHPSLPENQEQTPHIATPVSFSFGKHHFRTEFSSNWDRGKQCLCSPTYLEKNVYSTNEKYKKPFYSSIPHALQTYQADIIILTQYSNISYKNIHIDKSKKTQNYMLHLIYYGLSLSYYKLKLS